MDHFVLIKAAIYNRVNSHETLGDKLYVFKYINKKPDAPKEDTGGNTMLGRL